MIKNIHGIFPDMLHYRLWCKFNNKEPHISEEIEEEETNKIGINENYDVAERRRKE